MRIFTALILAVVGALTLAAQDDSEGVESASTFTYHRADGNRFVAGAGSFPNIAPVDLPLAGAPSWIVGTLTESIEGPAVPIWAVILENGDLQGTFPEADGSLSISPVIPEQLAPGTPPVFTVNAFGAFLEQDAPADASPLTHPVRVGERIIYISTGGDIVLLGDDSEELLRLPLGALPDARIVVSRDGLAAIYVGATDQRYVHGIMGDALEGAALMILDAANGVVPTIIDLGGDEVFEGLSPIWADVDGDGVDDLITTVSFGGGGAQARVYRAADGSALASGPAIGQSGRWRHLLAWGAFGPNGENELVEVLTPHIGGIVGFYRYDGGDALEILARRDGYTSHVINSRNLDMAVAGDFDGDGQAEIVIPNQSRTLIAGIRHGADGSAEVAWELPLDGTIVTNLSAIALEDGRIALAAGISDGAENRLRVWTP